MNIKVRKGNESTYNMVYLGLLSWYCFHSVISSSYISSFFGINISSASTIIKYVFPIILMGLFVLRTIYSPKMPLLRAYIIAGTSIVFCLVFYTITSTDLLMSFMFIITFPQNLSLKKVAKRFYFWRALGILYVVSFFYLGLISEYVRKRGTTLRHSIGFVSANSFANSVAFTVMAFLYYNIDKWKLRHSIILLVIDIYLYNQTRSRMACLFILIICIFGLLYNYIKNSRLFDIIYIFDSWAYGVFTISLLGMIIFFSGRTGQLSYQVINRMLSDRLMYSIQYYKEYGLHLLGQSIKTVTVREAASLGVKWTGLDCSYLVILIKYGILTGVGFAVLYYWLCRRLKTKNNFVGAFLVFLILFYSLTENCFYQIQNNFTLFILAYEIYDRRYKYSANVNRDG